MKQKIQSLDGTSGSGEAPGCREAFGVRGIPAL
jgi:hypothetical protein